MTEYTRMPKIIPDDEDYARYNNIDVIFVKFKILECSILATNEVLQYFSSWNHAHVQDEELANALNIVQKKLPATLAEWQEWAATVYHERR